MQEIIREMHEIGRLIASAELLMAVRREVVAMRKDGFVVTDGRHHHGASEYDVVVRLGNECDDVARRIRGNIPDVRVEKIAAGVIGIKRGKGEEHDA